VCPSQVRCWLAGEDQTRGTMECIVKLTIISQFAYSATYFFEQAGLSPDNTYKLNLGGTAIAFVGTILSWFLMRYFGRRSTYCTGIGLMSIYLFIIGCLDYAHNQDATWTQSALCLIWLVSALCWRKMLLYVMTDSFSSPSL
jgi:hypothetical protein